MNSLFQDIHYGIRTLTRNPGFTVIAVITLALGIGANTAIFSVISGVLLKPLPYEAPEQLVVIDSTSEYIDIGAWVQGVAYQNFLDWQTQQEAFAGMGALEPTQFRLIGDGTPERINGAHVTAGFFPTLGIHAVQGRLFGSSDEHSDAPLTAILSHKLWQRRFGADPGIIGRVLTLDNESHTIIGVLPADFRFPLEISDAEVFTIIHAGDKAHASRQARALEAIARLKPGVTRRQAQTQMDAIAARLEEQYPRYNPEYKLTVQGLHEVVVGDTRPALFFLQGAVAIVLLIACANGANLFLTRGTARGQELAVRAALGAGRFRLIRQLLTESMLVGLLGGVVGVILAYWGTDLLVAALPAEVPLKKSIEIDVRVLGTALVASVLTGLVFGLPAAIRASRPAPYSSVKEGCRSGGSHGRHRLQNFFVVAQTALALVLLVGAGLLIRSFKLLVDVDPGFVPEHVLTFRIDVSEAAQPAQRTHMLYELQERISALPGVQSATACGALPLGRGSMAGMLNVLDEPSSKPRIALLSAVTESYFSTMQIPVLRGRDFSEHDVLGSMGVALIAESMAKQYWPNEDPIGKRITLGMKETKLSPDYYRIVGIVGDVRSQGLDENPPPQIYVPYRQHPHREMNVALRTMDHPENLIPAIRTEVASVIREDAPFSFATMDDHLADSVAGRRCPMLLLGAFAALAIALATVGVYGMLSYTVAQRTHELGVRMALGARRRTILVMVFRQGAVLTGIGIILGIGLSLASTRFLANQLYGISATDTVTFAGVSVLLAAAAAMACYFPARRATRVDPMVALRCE